MPYTNRESKTKRRRFAANRAPAHQQASSPAIMSRCSAHIRHPPVRNLTIQPKDFC